MLVSPDLLREALHLPIGTKITWAGIDRHATELLIELTIEHPDLRDLERAEIEPPLIRPRFQRERDVVLLVDWGQ
jgi:hypothetical protein